MRAGIIATAFVMNVGCSFSLSDGDIGSFDSESNGGGSESNADGSQRNAPSPTNPSDPGNDVPVTTPSGPGAPPGNTTPGNTGGTPGPGGPLKAFVTSTLTQGKALGGVTGADAICNNTAKAAGLAGNYVAWISASNANAVDRVKSNGPWKLVDGTQIAASKADFTRGGLAAAFRKDEKGAVPPVELDFVWTGTGPNGTVADATCADWSANGTSGKVGEAERTDNRWTLAQDLDCTEARRLYCLEQ
jgi:hypothetical protein